MWHVHAPALGLIPGLANGKVASPIGLASRQSQLAFGSHEEACVWDWERRGGAGVCVCARLRPGFDPGPSQRLGGLAHGACQRRVVGAIAAEAKVVARAVAKAVERVVVARVVTRAKVRVATRRVAVAIVVMVAMLVRAGSGEGDYVRAVVRVDTRTAVTIVVVAAVIRAVTKVTMARAVVRAAEARAMVAR